MKFLSTKFFKSIIYLFLFALIRQGFAATIILEKAPIDTHDKASIERGAKFFAGNCMMCHSLKFLKRDPFAKAAGIDYQKMPIQAQQWWANRPPPDLSLEAQARGADWIYTYLHSFYQDPSVPSGNNNLLVEHTNMPNPFTGLQGVQSLVIDKKTLTEEDGKKLRWFDAVELVQAGSMTPEEFDNTIADVVNFLVHVSDPMRIQRERLGWWVLGFLVIFLILVFLLKISYWKELKKK
jgi:ubiquinol-cytochrome c reductase cytochrome c1 subunit